MSKAKTYRLTVDARGEFSHEHKRVSYDLEAGILGPDVDTRVRDRLIRLGHVIEVKAEKKEPEDG